MAAPDYCPCSDRSLADRLRHLEDLDAAPPTPSRPGPLTARQRGYCLEALLTDALAAEGLEPRASYRTAGEQIDGSFVIDGRALLLEAKWHADRLPASEIYAFKGKVDGKLVGTIGLMLAVNGFSDDAPDTLAAGKDLNVLLAVGDDLVSALSPSGSLRGMVTHKLRAAVDAGAVFAPYRVTIDGASRQPVRVERDDAAPSITFIVEGPLDEKIVGVLGHRVLRDAGSSLRVETQAARGIENAGLVAGAVRQQLGPEPLVGVVVDADAEDPGERQMRLGMTPAVRGRQIPIIAAAPTLEADWLAVGPDVGRRHRDRLVEQRLALVRVDVLETTSASFARFAGILRRYAADVG